MIDAATLAQEWGQSDCQFSRLLRAHEEVLRPHLVTGSNEALLITPTGAAILAKLTGHSLSRV